MYDVPCGLALLGLKCYGKQPVRTLGGISQEELFCPTSCCCAHYYCYCGDCLGCQGKSQCLCCLEKGHCKFVGPTTCLKCKSQFLCCVNRAAFPCDAEVPCALALCGAICVGKQELEALKQSQAQQQQQQAPPAQAIMGRDYVRMA